MLYIGLRFPIFEYGTLCARGSLCFHRHDAGNPLVSLHYDQYYNGKGLDTAYCINMVRSLLPLFFFLSFFIYLQTLQVMLLYQCFSFEDETLCLVGECYDMEQLELEKLGEDWLGVAREISGQVAREISGQVVEFMGI